MRTADFPALAARLRNAATTFGRLAPIVQAVADDPPPHVPPVVVKGVPRPTEAVASARDERGITAALADVRASAIQAVLHAERAIAAADQAERAFTVGPLGATE